ncbi:type II CAAX endopeptidase family protein [Tissierella sp. Yu-01]|uniref:CPBP family intramembrane glutamic endopeptidase n=1 Tax=Tissierella sp. Yu-01 TaxID=3035694 RepID=UPI00240DDF1C|nr:type II CAAX endopeptidase family protein [Tissierella sp. Yu-01]WFA10174.1 type II CAAX endopeptidase family protein [Tissierella sp. Yu-01]
MFSRNLSLFDEAKRSKIKLNGFISVILSIIMIFVGQIIGQIFLIFLSQFISIQGIMVKPIYLIFTFLFPLLLCFIWVKLVEKRRIGSLGLSSYKFVSKFFIGFFIGFLMFSAVTLLMYITGTIEIDQNIDVGINYFPAILAILPGWILQSSTEEIITRGWLMHIIGAKHRPIIGFIVSSILFGVLHIFNPGVTYLSIMNIILVGFFFGLYVIKTQDVWSACGLHAAWNFTQGNIFGFSVSGGSILSTDTLMSFTSQGGDILTGGAFGPEASIFSTIVLIIGILVLILRKHFN